MENERSASDPAGTISLFVCGDVMMGRGIDQLLPSPCEPTLYEPCAGSARDYIALAEQANGPMPRSVAPSYPWGDALADLDAHGPDLRIINLETSVTRCAVPEPKGINYRMSPENFAAIADAQIDCCALANNHVLDWGEPGLIETLKTIEAAETATAGAGRNIDEASMPAALTVPGKGRALVYACATTDSGVPLSWLPGPDHPGAPDHPGVNVLPDLSTARARDVGRRIGRVRKSGDLVIVSIHWGGNWGYAIPAAHRRFAHALVDEAGADLVHGHSSHHPKPIELYRDHPVLYGCGDFITDYEGIAGHESFRDDLVLMYLAELRMTGGALARLRMVPYQIRKFRLNRAAHRDAHWLRDVLNRESRRFGSSVSLDDLGQLQLEL
jgi:poly-gamma-glutamate capsule biosynthesis protein CapA/YwtB (metallophosphatase superfamily)